MRSLLICSLAILLANCIQAADVFKNEKVRLGKRTCTCTFTMETKGNKCAGQAKCDKKCTGNGAVEVGDYSFTLAVKKGKGKIAKCTVAVMPTVGPVEPTGSGSGPVEPTGSGSGSGPVEPTGSGSGEVPVPMGEGMPCSCRCNCPDGAEQCDCDCNCPMMSTSVSCASGFTRVCPMMSDVCPTDTMMMCPNGGMPPAAGRMMHGSSGSSGCQCVPDFLMALVHHAMPAATRMEATDRAKDVFKNEKVKLGKRTCTCTFTMETKGSKCAGQAKCDNKCTGNGAVEVGDYSFTLAVKKGKGKISKCTVAAMPTVGPVEPTGSGSGPAPTGSGTGPMPPTGSGSGMENPMSRCTCVGNGGSGPTPPTGSGSGPNPPTGTGSGSGEDLKLRQLSRSRFPLARCNDGTQATYYVQPGRHSGKVMIWLQGGGACWSEEMCNERCASSHEDSELCTAQNEAEITFRGREEGVLDPYADYWMVYVHYCSSDLWAGTKSASQATGGYHFLGKYIIEAVIEDLTSNYNLQNANTVVFTGCSAGAVGVTLNCDDIGAKLPSADFRCVADAPDFFPPDASIAPGCFARDPQFQNKATEFWGRKYDQSCQEFADNTGVKNVGELCGVLARSLEFVSSPILVMTPFFDPAITIIHGCQESYEEQGDQEFEKFKERWMTGHKKEVDNLMSTKPEIAFFVPNCVIHCMTYGYPDLSVKNSVTGQQTGIAGFISGWLAGDGKSPLYAVDEITITNPTCEDED